MDWDDVLLGVAVLTGVYFVRSLQVTTPIVNGANDASGATATFNARLTSYTPTGSAGSMEGGPTDRKGRPLITYEQHKGDPGTYPYCSVAGDYTVFPDGQRISIDWDPAAVFRVVDTGGHFFGANKVYRIAGYEPLDICVDASLTTKPPTTAVVTIYGGDSYSGAEVDASNMNGQSLSPVAENDFGGDDNGDDDTATG